MEKKEAIEKIRNVFEIWKDGQEYQKNTELGAEGELDGCGWKCELAMTEEQLKYINDPRRIIVYYLSDYTEEMEADKNQWTLVSLYDLVWMLYSGCY